MASVGCSCIHAAAFVIVLHRPRAIKHLHELTLLQRQGAVQPPPRLAAALSSGGGGGGGGGSGVTVDADGRVPAQAAVLFVVNRWARPPQTPRPHGTERLAMD
jgi:hypothetical protein